MYRRRKGFTLIELLVVLGIITLLTALLLPTLLSARSSANTTLCASNMRQIVLALISYASDHEGKFPPNVSMGQNWKWNEVDRIGRYLPGCTVILPGSGGLGKSVLVCPSDPDSSRSYSMNYWASCIPDVTAHLPPLRGVNWPANVRNSSKMILLAEAYSKFASSSFGHFAPDAVGNSGDTPAKKFGAGVGITPLINAGRWGLINCELDYMRHRQRGEGTGTQAKGRLNFGYADGHVALKLHLDLVNENTKLSTLDSWWSPADPELNK